jgi:hypothetical protein
MRAIWRGGSKPELAPDLELADADIVDDIETSGI